MPSIRRTTALCAALAALVLLTACAGPTPRERMATRLSEVQALAGDPVQSFRYQRMVSWEALGEADLAVWTSQREVWWIRVHEPCNDLDFAPAIGLTSSNGRVYAKFDAVIVEGARCSIRDIRPVDGAALRALRQKKRAE